MSGYDFANVLFAGPCNRRCPGCIGERVPAALNAPNLDTFPPKGLDAFVSAVNEHRVREIVFTGTVTDPQLYRHERALLDLLRRRLHAETRFSLHTNGVLALRKRGTFNAYDRACVSLPSFRPDTYERMMGSRRVPDLGAILRASAIPVKVSCLMDSPNIAEIEDFLERCAELGVRRVVLRRLFGETRRWPVLAGHTPSRWFMGNPVYEVAGMEVTHWDFDEARFRSLNLFADGTLGTSYFLTDTFESFRPTPSGPPPTRPSRS
jgi:hypothetical protein